MMSLDNCFMRTKYLFFITVLWSLFSITAWGQSAVAQGEKAYTEQNYVDAVVFFKKAVQETPTAENYYNLGNANYRLKQYPEAVIAYLRCLRIDPSNEDARYNLQLTQQKIAPGTTTLESQPWESPFTLLLNLGSVKRWTAFSFLFLLLAFVGWTLFRTASHHILQKSALFATFFLTIAFVVCTIFAVAQRYRFYHNHLAVVTAEEAQSYASPMTNAKKELVLPSGSVVYLQENAAKGWTRVQTSDGTETWIHTSLLVRVQEKD